MIASLVGAVGVLALLTIVPGPDMAVVTRAAIVGSLRSARATAGGVVSGLMIWGLLAVGGLAAVLAASAEAYAGLRFVGAGYLVWLGLRTLVRSRRSVALPRADYGEAQGPVGRAGTPAASARCRAGRRPPAGGFAAWRVGLVTNLLNPKIGVFYTSVLPQLVPAGAPTAATQAGLVLAHAGLTLVWLDGWARALGRSGSVLRRRRVSRDLERLSGVVLVGLGLEIAVTSRLPRIAL